MYLIDLTVEAYGEYLRALFFFGGVVFLRWMMEIRSIAAEGEADQNRMIWRDGWSKFLPCRRHKWMTPKWKNYRNLCKNLKLLIYALYVSKLS